MAGGLRMTREELVELLESGKNTRKKYKKWGTVPGTNSVDDLLRDVNDGSVRVFLVEDEVWCFRQSVCVTVFYRKRTGTLVRLYESYRVIRGKRRMRNLPCVRESSHVSIEHACQTAVRCFAEELGIHDVTPDDFWELFAFEPGWGKPYESKLFPGLLTVRHTITVEHEMQRRHYRPEGYRVIEDGVTIVFKWRPERNEKPATEPAIFARAPLQNA